MKSKRDYGGKIIELICSDLEGCLTPAKRTRTNLLGLKKIQDYCSLVPKYKLPPINLVTGRSAPYVEAVIQTIGAIGDDFYIPSVIENGAMFYDHNKRNIWGYNPFVEKNKKSLHEVRELVNALKKEYKQNMREEPGKEICISLNPIELGINDLYGIIKERIEEMGFDEFVDITHSSSAVDITPKNVNKRSGLFYILGEFGIPSKYCLGIGDTFGDVDWLKEIGYPTCPLNATEDVKKINGIWVADYEDAEGVAEIIQHFILKNVTKSSAPKV